MIARSEKHRSIVTVLRTSVYINARWVVGRALAVVALTLACGVPQAIVPAPALAGDYQVYSCEQPDGQPAPTDGWSGSINGPFMNPVDNCASGGSLAALLDGSPAQPVNAIATWTFTAPPYATIGAATLWASFQADSITEGSAESLGWLAAPENGYDSANVFDQCITQGCGSEGEPSDPFASANEVVIPAAYLDGSHIYVNASCGGAAGGSCPAVSSPYMAETQLLAADITLQTDAAPSASAVGGSLTTEQDLDGPQNILITASDPGPGVYQAIFEIDGSVVSSSVLESNGERCQNVAPAGSSTPAFLYVQPCPAQVNSVDVAFDPASISDGPHELKVLVSDAAGEETTILDRQVIVNNGGAYTTLLARGACNGDPCDEHAQLIATSKQGASFPRRFSHSATKLTGRLLDHEGASIAGAQVKLLEQPAESGAAIVEVQSVSTNQSGEWTLTAPRGPSRMLQVAYYSHLKDTAPAATLVYHERVPAAISMRARAHVRVGHTVVFYGRILGGYLPAHGEAVQMEIRYDGRWRTIEVLRTGKHGRFAYRYIFSLGAGSSYLFRAVSLYSSAYPFAAAASRPVRVEVRG